MLVAGDDRGNVEVWSLPSDFERRFSTGQGAVESVAFSHDGTMLATGGTDHTIRLWEGRSLAPRERLTGAMGAVYAVAFSPDEKTVAASGSDQLIRLWSVPDGQQRRTIPGSNGAVYGLAFSPNGRILASAGADNDVRLWDPATGVMLGTPLALDSNWVNSVAFGASSDLLASASTDGTVRVWSGILWSGLSGLTQTVCGAVGTGLSTAQFTQYAPLVGEHENCPTAPDG
jgi:WD40 repeat protein